MTKSNANAPGNRPFNEFEYLDELLPNLARRLRANRQLIIPPGDDTAECGGTGSYLFAADMLLDGVHFCLDEVGPELCGRKALAVNLSDIAAMAGSPEAMTVSIAAPKKNGVAITRGVMEGALKIAEQYQLAIAGGDTNSWHGPLVLAVSITGRPHPKGSVRRGGAQPGDGIFVTGPLGGSLLSGHHLNFMPRVQEAQALHQRYGLNAMIDLSDGLGSDLRHILKQSSVGARLHADRIPIHDAALKASSRSRALSCALSDGEDFELCFTLSHEAAAQLESEPELFPTIKPVRIGTITKDPELIWSDGSPVTERGFVHEFQPPQST